MLKVEWLPWSYACFFWMRNWEVWCYKGGMETLHKTIEILQRELEKADKALIKAIVDKSLLKAVAGDNERLQERLQRLLE